MQNLKYKDRLFGSLYGVLVGDALGVPVEFVPKNELKLKPVTEMIGYGTYDQPPGTWSDDSSMTLCLIEMLNKDYDLTNLGYMFYDWYSNGRNSPFGIAFDIGNTTKRALMAFNYSKDPKNCGLDDFNSNGNGSLMRIMPLLYYIKDMSEEERIKHICEISSITHANIVSVLSCYFYLEFALEIIKGNDKFNSFKLIQSKYNFLLSCDDLNYINFFYNKVSDNNLNNFKEGLKYLKFIEQGYQNEINFNDLISDGYVINTLDTAFRCILKYDNFQDTVLAAVNQGYDTDTSAAVTGGLAGIIYGYKAIPIEWINALQNIRLVKRHINKFIKKYK